MRKYPDLARNSIHAHIAHIIKTGFSRRSFYGSGKFTAGRFHRRISHVNYFTK